MKKNGRERRIALRRKQLHLITTGRQSLDDVLYRLQALSAVGRTAIDCLHIREKQRPAREVIEWYHAIKAVLPQVQICINDRLDAAWAVQADCVQLAWHSLDVAQARALLAEQTRIGVSVHNIEEIQLAADADFFLFGHVFETASKSGLIGRGVDTLLEVVQQTSKPVIALGGINSKRITQVMASGCAGVAVMSGFFEIDQVEIELLKIREALDMGSFS
jgi:thiazole tautomerase (transcriptional regulator TenI)